MQRTRPDTHDWWNTWYPRWPRRLVPFMGALLLVLPSSAHAAKISGYVTDVQTGVPLSASIQIFHANGTPVGLTVSSAVSGFYLSSGILGSGTYFAVARSAEYITEAYNDVRCVPCFTSTILGSTPISVVGGQVTEDVNFALRRGSAIIGTVTDAATGSALEGVEVRVVTPTGALAHSRLSDATGAYRVSGLPAGTYYVRTGIENTYEPELFSGTPCPNSSCLLSTGVPIVIGLGTNTYPGIDFSLTPTGSADVAIDFGGAHGVWMLSAGSAWQPLHASSADAIVTGDLDGNSRDDLVIDFGPGSGVYAWLNHTTWVSLHPSSPSLMAAGDLDHNGRDEVLFVFPGAGLWRWADGAWSQLHDLDPVRLAVGRLDQTPGDDLVVGFAGHGIFVFSNNSAWSALHPAEAAAIEVADLTGNGIDEVVIDFPGAGLWIYRDTNAWTALHPLNAAHVASGHLDSGARSDLVIDFGPGLGLWIYSDDATWTPLHGQSSESIHLADRDENQKDEVLVDFGPGLGLWQYANGSTWTQLHNFSPESLATGQLH